MPEPFTQTTLDAVLAEADAAGLRGASKITEALRKQLTDIKRGDAAKVPDNRSKPYFAVGIVWLNGRRTVTTDAVEIVGLSMIGTLFHSLYDMALEANNDYPADIANPATLEAQTNGVRANLTRKGEGHYQLTSMAAPMKHWLDVFVYNTQTAAEGKLAALN